MTDVTPVTSVSHRTLHLPDRVGAGVSRDALADWVLWGLLGAFVLGLVQHGTGFEPLVDGWLGSLTTLLPSLALVERARRHTGPARRQLLLLGSGALMWSIGGINVVLAAAQDRALPFPSWGDLLFLAFPVLVFVALADRVRRELSGLKGSVWLDSALGALGATTMLAILLGPLISGLSGGPLAAAVAAAYPLSDLMLVAIVVGVTVSCGLRPGRSWLWLMGGLLVFATADVVYALRISYGAYALGTPLDALWSAGLTIIATGCRPPGSASSTEHPAGLQQDHAPGQRTALAVPALATAVALTALVLGRWVAIPPIATGLATATLLAAAVRTQLAFQQVVKLHDLGRQARTDSLTGLGNRRALHEHLRPRLRGDRPESLAVLLIDLDHFKEVNDALGHPVGDDLLRQIGPRMGRVLGASDLMVRLGGDEFAVVVKVGVGVGVTAEERAQQLLDQLVEPFLLEDVTLRVGASIGIAESPRDASDANGLIRRADVAMYAAKADGGGVQRYDLSRDQHSRERLRTIEELRGAVDRGELTLHYQPQCDVTTGVVVGIEALVRWQHPARGLLYPDQFLALVEQTGLMPGLTVAVLGQAVRQCRRWRDEGFELGVSVNISVSSLLDERLGDQISSLLAEHGLPASALTLELTEDSLMADPERCRSTLMTLSETGVLLSIDDYGTGYCSLSYLQNLPVDELKLDRSFLADLHLSRNAAIVRSTIDLAHALGLRLVAEGVEDEPSLELLQRFGCDTAQGFHLSRPKPAEEITRWLLDNPDRLPCSSPLDADRLLSPTHGPVRL